MKIARGTNAVALDWIKDKLILHQHEDREIVLSILKNQLQANKDYTLLLVAYDDSQEPVKLLGFAMGWLNINKQLFIPQAWVDSKEDSTVLLKIAQRFLHWAEQFNCTELVAETKRSLRALERRWGFEFVSTNVKLKLNDTLHDKVALYLNKEILNGRRNKHSVSEQSVHLSTTTSAAGDREEPNGSSTAT